MYGGVRGVGLAAVRGEGVDWKKSGTEMVCPRVRVAVVYFFLLVGVTPPTLLVELEPPTVLVLCRNVVKQQIFLLMDPVLPGFQSNLANIKTKT